MNDFKVGDILEWKNPVGAPDKWEFVRYGECKVTLGFTNCYLKNIRNKKIYPMHDSWFVKVQKKPVQLTLDLFGGECNDS